MDNVRKFEDFLVRMRWLLDNAKRQGHIIVRVEDLESAFPELAESKDEKIRRELIKVIEEDWPGRTDFIDWLEKQKPVTVPIFRVGDRIIEKSFDECGYGTIQEIKDGKYIFDDGGFITIEEQNLWRLVEQKPVARAEEDERIRKELLEHCKNQAKPYIQTGNKCPQIQSWIAWLEKQKPKAKPKWLYRLEYKDDTCGLWYNGKGEWCYEKGIGFLDDTCITKSLPMGYDERYKQDGRDWFSSCSDKKDLLHWYSKSDARKLLNKGFVFARYLATEYNEYEHETVFIKDTALYRDEIDFFSLFGNEWTEDDEHTLQGIIDEIKADKKLAKDWEGRTYDRFLSWLKSIKGRIQPQPKKWSEEDERMTAFAKSAVKGFYSELGLQPSVLKWLETLKERI